MPFYYELRALSYELKRGPMGHKSIPVDELKPGMVLARKIVGHKDNLMAGKGVELTGGMIERLKRFGVKRAFVEWKEAGSVDPELVQKQIHELEAALDSRFRKVAHIPIMNELKVILLNHLKEKILHGQG